MQFKDFYYSYSRSGKSTHRMHSGVFRFDQTLSVPFINVGSISVLNTFSPHDDQSKLQGIRSSLGRIAKVSFFYESESEGSDKIGPI